MADSQSVDEGSSPFGCTIKYMLPWTSRIKLQAFQAWGAGSIPAGSTSIGIEYKTDYKLKILNS